MSEKVEIEGRLEDVSEFYEDLNAPEGDQFIINPNGCVIMSVDVLWQIANDEVKENLLKSGFFEIEEIKDAETDQ